MANSSPVVIASNQSSVPVSITTSTVAGAQVDIRKFGGFSVSLGPKNTNNSIPVVMAGNQLVTVSVSGTVTTSLASSTLSGLQVNLTKATTSVLSGVQVSVTKFTTAVFSGSQVVVYQTNSANLRAQVSGNIPNASTDSGNPVKVGGVYNTALPTLTNGQRGDAQMTAKGQFMSVVFDAAGNNRGANVNASNQLSVSVDALSTSTIAGTKVLLENTSVPLVTTTSVAISASASGDNVVLPAPGAGKQIYVYNWTLSFSGTVNAKFTDGLTSKNLTGLIYGTTSSGGGGSVSPNFLMNKPQPDVFHTSANSRLLINLSGATAVGGMISYFII